MTDIPETWPADSVERVNVESLVPYARNARTHSAEQVDEIAASIREWGWTIPVLVDESGTLIAGHGRLLAARQLGIESVPAMRAVGWSESKRRAYAIADNKLALNAGWDNAMLAAELGDLGDIDMSLTGFSEEDFADLLASLDGDDAGEGNDEGAYTRKVVAPIYEPSGPKPELQDLYDDAKTRKLRAEIQAADVPEDIKAFLRIAADRHTIFNFARIANYYAHSPPAVQDLMERSALVIIDFGKAIEYGFVNLTEDICKQYAADYPDA